MKKIIAIAVFSCAFSLTYGQSQPTTDQQKLVSPLFVIDGQIQPEWVPSKNDPSKKVRPIENIDYTTINTIEVLNGEKAISKYGEAGKNSVVEVTIKKSK